MESEKKKHMMLGRLMGSFLWKQCCRKVLKNIDEIWN